MVIEIIYWIMRVKTITEQLFFTTVRIDTAYQDGSSGSGTGFMFVCERNGQHFPFVVTNKHVVANAARGSITFLQGSNKEPVLGKGYKLEIQGWEDVWTGHPDSGVDIAVCPFEPLKKHAEQAGFELFYRVVSLDDIPSPADEKELDAIEPITFIGYPNGIWDSTNLLPVARRGTTASPIEVDFDGKPKFLIDASVFGGSSGSPVFVLNQGSWESRNGEVKFGSRMYFVGVIAAVYFKTELNEVIPAPIPTQFLGLAKQQEMIDLGIVFKARTVVETIEFLLRSRNLI